MKTAHTSTRLDQTYNTPSLATLFLLANQLDWMLEHGGLEWAAARCDRSAEVVFGWAEGHQHAAPVVAQPHERRPVTATLGLDLHGHPAALAAALRAHGIGHT